MGSGDWKQDVQRAAENGLEMEERAGIYRLFGNIRNKFRDGDILGDWKKVNFLEFCCRDV